jgi:gliding motility-associated-like protein
LAELICAQGVAGQSNLTLDIMGLTPGATYFIRVSDYSFPAPPNWGTFNLCVDLIPTEINITNGNSTLCSGTLYDSGGPNADYGSNEDFTYVICPSQPTACINFTLEYFNIEPGNFFTQGDILTLYDGNNTSSPVLVEFQGGGIGDIPPAAGGGVAFHVQAKSGCITVHFQSDDSVEFEGWKAQWTCSTTGCTDAELPEINTSITKADIVNAVSTPATTVNVTNINCKNGQYGTFNFATDNNNELGLNKGLILTSGSAALAIGPNDVSNAGQDNMAPGDADLDYLSNGTLSHDACVVEMDVFAATDQLSFEYVFGSDEYPEYANSLFNDIFAFLVSGPGITGDPNIGNAINIATLPGSNTPVQINSVNNLVNWKFYRNNEISQTLQYDGLTSDSLGFKKSLTARTSVIPCNTYHLKLAVADRNDGIYDSGVFVSKIQGGTPDVKTAFSSGLDYLIESCPGSNNEIVFTIPDPLPQPATYVVTIGGTATFGVDYTTTLPGTITFQPGETKLTFPISPIDDGLVEGSETITITMSNSFGCGTVVYKVLTFTINDNALVQVKGGDTLFVCTGKSLQLQATGAANYFWSPPSAVSNAFIANPTITPVNNILLKVTGSVGACVSSDSVYIQILSPAVEAVALSPANICTGAQVQLSASNNTGGMGISWSPATGLSSTTDVNPIASPSKTTTYTVKLSVGGCVVTDTVTIHVDTLFFPKLTTLDTTVCEHYPVQLAPVLINTTSYTWTPTAGLSNPNISGPVATPDQTTVYTLVATSAHQYCSQTAVVNIHVTPVNVQIAGDHYREVCLGDTVFLKAQATPVGAQVKWSPSFLVNNPTGLNVFSVPDESVVLHATYTINGCTVFDSVRIRVDSLPLSAIKRMPDKSIYCPGDTIYFLSKTYEPASFPDIKHNWDVFGNELTPLSNWNMVITATATHTFTRTMSNHACFRIDSVVVPVAQPPQLSATVDPPQICPGQQAHIHLNVSPSGSGVTWDNDQPCKDCLDAVVSPASTTVYHVTSDPPCPLGAYVTVEVLQYVPLIIPSDATLCQGQSVQLNTAPGVPGVSYNWTSVPTGFGSSQPNPVVTPAQTTTYNLIAEGSTVCTTTGTVTFTVLPVPDLTATINPIEVCKGQPAQIQLTVTPSGTPVAWNADVTLSCLDCLNPIATPQTTTTYHVATPGPCPAQKDFTIQVLPPAVFQFPVNPTICPGLKDTLNKAPAQPGVSYFWSSNPSGFFSSLADPVAKPTVTTTYKVHAEGNNICPTDDSVTVTVNKSIISLGADLSVCTGNPITLNAAITGTGGAGTTTWKPVNKTGVTIVETPLQTTAYIATFAYGPNNGCNSKDTVKVTVLPVPTISAITKSPIGDTLCLGTTLSLKVAVTPKNAAVVWTENGIPIPGKTTDSISVVSNSGTGTTAYNVTATNSLGCSTTGKEISYDFKRCFDVPNVFTPGNNDQLNDTFGPVTFGATVEVVTFVVFDRWGKKVFEYSPNHTTWDGKVDGADAPSDVYAFVIRVRYPNGLEDFKQGSVTLLR